MATLSEAQIAAWLAPYLGGPWGLAELPAGIYGQLAAYLDLLLRWNERTNLTAIRAPEEIVRRHFGESVFAGLCLGKYLAQGATVLDVGSGAGFPGLPIQLLRPDWRVTVAESQGKKAAFLREAVRVLGLEAEVWAGRVEALQPEQRFDAVTLRAVDRMKAMVAVGRLRVVRGGVLLRFVVKVEDVDGAVAMPGGVGGAVLVERVGRSS